ncbi:MAG: alginate lyase family protein [Planctomycetes bacterium]|nr:alginate lyase family protein [Planctomycetota bacterium]
MPDGFQKSRPFLRLSAEWRQRVLERLKLCAFLRDYWRERVLLGLAEELSHHAPGQTMSVTEGRAGATLRMALGWKMTQDDRYARAAWGNLVGPLQGVPTGMLSMGGRTIELATALSWLEDWPGVEEGPATRARTRIAEMTEAMFQYFNPPPFGTLHLNRGENWDAQILAALGIGASCLHDHPRSAAWLAQAEMSAAEWLGRRAGDGGLCEGSLNYHLYALWNMTQLADVLREFGRTDLFAQPGLRKMFEFLVYTLAPDGRVPGFNDSERTNLHKRNAQDTLLLKAASEYGDPMFLWAYQRVRADFPVYYECFPYVLLHYPEGEASGPPDGVDSMAFPHVGWVSMRNGWDRRSTHLVLKAGPWGGWHDHLDRSTFELVGRGVPLAVDTGCGSYEDRMDWFRRTESHNVVLIDGRDQFPLGGRIVRFFSSAVADYAAVDCRRALMQRDGGMGTGYLRQVLYDKLKDRFIFLDRITGATRCTWLLHGRGDLVIGEQQGVWTTREGVRLSARFLSPRVALDKNLGPASGVDAYAGPPEELAYLTAVPAGTETSFVVLLETLAGGEEACRAEAMNPAGSTLRLWSGEETTHVQWGSSSSDEQPGDLRLNGAAACVGSQGSRLRRLALIGTTRADFAGRTLFESPSAADLSLGGCDRNRLEGKIHVWGELAEMPILTCDGLAASIFREVNKAGRVEVSAFVPWRPARVLVGGRSVPFSYVKDSALLSWEIEAIGTEFSLVIMGQTDER